MSIAAKRIQCCMVLLVACAIAGETPTLPDWLTPYPGATAQTVVRTSYVLSSYETSATLDDVIAHYRALFEGAGLAFHPRTNPVATTIPGDIPECDLLVTIQKWSTRTRVHITCSVKARTAERKEAQRQAFEAQARFDQPVYPKPRRPLPPLTWPDWLTTCEAGVSPEVENGVDNFKLRYLKAVFTAHQDRDSIQAFYADLLNAHDYPVWIRSSKLYAPDRAATVEGQHFFDGKIGPRFTIHVEVTPVAEAMRVELRITAHPF